MLRVGDECSDGLVHVAETHERRALGLCNELDRYPNLTAEIRAILR